MRKIILSLAFFFYISNFCYAAPCYGPKMPQKKQFFWGFQTHAVLKRKLEKDYGQIRSLQHFLLISYGLFDWFCLDLKGGAGNIKEDPNDGSDEREYPSFMAGGYGFRLRIYEEENTKLVFGFQHISVHPDSVKIAQTKHKGVLDDWQFSLITSQEFSKITPYLGVRWSRMDYIHWVDTNTRKRKRSDLTKSAGLIIGLDISLNEKVWFNLEGNFLDAEAAALSLNFRF